MFSLENTLCICHCLKFDEIEMVILKIKHFHYTCIWFGHNPQVKADVFFISLICKIRRL